MKRTDKWYIVIKFIELPYKDIDDYICIPWSWIALRKDGNDQQLMVFYPVENPSETAKRVKKRQKPSEDWKIYIADREYGTDLYEDAQIFINEKMKDVKCSNIKKKDQHLSTSINKKTRRTRQKSKSKIDKTLDLVVTSKKNDKSETKRLKRTALPTPNTEADLERSNVVEPTATVSDTAEQPSQMKRTDKFKYHVIKFLELPCKDIDEYVCVPCSWIVLRRKIDQKWIVSYPVENPSVTAKRVKKGQKHSDDWKLYMAVIEYNTDFYEDAKIFINDKMKCSNIKKRDQKLSASVNKKTRRTRQNSNTKIDKTLDLVVTSKKNDKSETKRLKRTALPTPDTEAALKRSNVVEPTETLSDTAEQSIQAFVSLGVNQPPPNREDFPMQNSFPSEIHVEESDDRSCVGEIEHAENIAQNQPSDNQNSSNLTNSSSDPKIMVEPTFFKDLFTTLRDLHTISANSYWLVDSLRKVIIDNAQALRDVKQLIADRRKNGDIPTTSPSTSTSVEIEKISEKNQSKQQKEHDEHGDADIDEVPKKRRRQKPKFVLPPEYDENDTRWTLKHREIAPGLVELMPYTNVYINSVALSNCKRLSKDYKSFARMLLVEIFTKSALTVCSFTGSRAKAYDVEGATIRPGLDENARTVLLTYVEEYGRTTDWIKVGSLSILNSLRNKMQEFRSKYG